MSTNGISVIVPAFNEEGRIEGVIELLKQVEKISEIIVVDDGSSDGTYKSLMKISGITPIKLEKNRGKTFAVVEGITNAKYEDILLMDADLIGLDIKEINEVIDTYLEGFDMVILDYGSQDWFLRRVVKSFPALSGVRILSKLDFDNIEFKKTDRFELETRINDYFLNNDKNIIVVTGKNVRTPHKYNKFSIHKGLYLEVMALREILLVNGRRNIPKLIRNWWKVNEMRVKK